MCVDGPHSPTAAATTAAADTMVDVGCLVVLLLLLF
jgi:hypothetical protein